MRIAYARQDEVSLTLIVEVSPRGGADRTRLTGGREAPIVPPPRRR
jgi:hypothetical protein